MAGGNGQNRHGRPDTPDFTAVIDRDNLEQAVLGLIKSDPFLTISELGRMVNTRYIDGKVRWLTLFRIMRRRRLLGRKARFRFAWGRL